MLLLAYQAPTDSQPEAQSAYGLTTLFQGRTWHADLGGYYYRARWYLSELGEFAERDPLGSLDSANLYQPVGYNPVAFRDPLGESITIRLYTGRSKLKPRMLDLIQVYVADIFRSGFHWNSPSDVRVLRYAYSLLGMGDARPRATGLPLLPQNYYQVGDFFTKAQYSAVPSAARKFAASYNFNFRAYVEMEGTRRKDAEGKTFVNKGYSIVYERVVWRSLNKLASAGFSHRDKFYDAMYFSIVVAHEVGHQFGLSPQDKSGFISGLGVMATHDMGGIFMAGLEKQLSEAEARARKAGIVLTPDSKEAIWLRNFSFSSYDRQWIRLLADPTYGPQ